MLTRVQSNCPTPVYNAKKSLKRCSMHLFLSVVLFGSFHSPSFISLYLISFHFILYFWVSYTFIQFHVILLLCSVFNIDAPYAHLLDKDEPFLPVPVLWEQGFKVPWLGCLRVSKWQLPIAVPQHGSLQNHASYKDQQIHYPPLWVICSSSS